MVEVHGWTELSDGDEFAGYRIERRLGRGGMGILYLAVEPGLDRRVALKLIAPEAAAEEVFARRFAEESRIAASIEHPNVVPIYAAGEEGGVPFIAMRYVAGSDLSRRIVRAGRLSPEQAVALIAQVANGLDAIHAAGLVHRDVKPANVLLSGGDGADHAYITDFGVARNVATQSGLTQTGRFVGTLDYVAPEQISGGAIDARVDVYALGCLLFKLLTGEVPFPREGEAARLYAHLSDPPPARSLYAPEVSMALDDVVVRAMSKQPDDRYPSAGDLGRAAVAALSGAPVTVPEHTVATGAAATVEPETVAPTQSTRESTPPEAAAQTGRLRPEPSEPLTEPNVDGPKRRPLLIAGGLAAIFAVVAVAIALSSGGGDGEKASGDTTATAEPKTEKKPEPEPDRLKTSQLIQQADAVCVTAQSAYKQARSDFPAARTEEVPDVAYSERLVENSSRMVEEFQSLVPPKSKAEEYGEYLESQEEVAQWDRDALAAAKANDASAYQEARDDRNDTEDNRTRMAEAIGFTVCSGSRL
jgi:serine/threonine protein kinase